MAKTKKLKYKQADGTLSNYIAIGADASNIDLQEGITLEELNSKLVRANGATLTNSEGVTINPRTKVEYISDAAGVSLSTLLNKNITQFSTMPEPSQSYEDRIVQYVGNTTTNPRYVQGYFYQCIYGYIYNMSTGESRYGYTWTEVAVQKVQSWNFDDTPTADSSNPVTSEGIKTYVDTKFNNVDLSSYYTKTETDNLLKNINLTNYYTKSEIDAMIGDIETLLSNI